MVASVNCVRDTTCSRPRGVQNSTWNSQIPLTQCKPYSPSPFCGPDWSQSLKPPNITGTFHPPNHFSIHLTCSSEVVEQTEYTTECKIPKDDIISSFNTILYITLASSFFSLFRECRLT